MWVGENVKEENVGRKKARGKLYKRKQILRLHQLIDDNW